MSIGWVQDKKDPSVWYYTGEIKDSSEGGLVKGWVTDPHDGKRYYTDPSTGIMCYGWKQLDGVWYYFGGKQYANASHPYGAMYVNEKTPDGYYVESNGAWRQNTSSGSSSNRKPTPVTTYTVTFSMQGHGTQIPQRTGVTSGSTITAPTAPTAAGFTFGGWYKEAACTNAWNFDTDTVTKDAVLYAKWTTIPVANYTVTFNLNGVDGTVPEPQMIASGSKATRPNDPAFEKHTLEGWYKTKNIDGTLSDKWDFDSPVTGDMTLYAKWTRRIASIIETVEFPMFVTDIPANAWVDSSKPNNKVYAQNNWLFNILYVEDDSPNTPLLQVYYGGSTYDIAEKVGNSYTYSNDYLKYTVTFDMVDDILASIKIDALDGASEAIIKAAGTYAAPAPVVHVTGVSLGLTKLNLQEGDTWKFTATIMPDNATNKNVTWSSNKESVATVNNGTVSAIAPGTATITVTTEDGNKTATCTVNVSETIDEADYTLQQKGTWFTTLIDGKEITKDRISEITFCNATPSEVEGIDGVDITSNKKNKVNGYLVPDDSNYKIYIVGDYIYGNISCQQMFNGFSKLTSIDFGNFDTSNVTDMTVMFSGCSGLTSLDLSNFNTSKVTTMESMFTSCSELESLNIAFDTTARKLKNTKNMFSGCSGLTSLTFDDQFDTSEVTTMVGMFSGCSGLTSLDLSSFNTSEVTTMMSMFSGCSGLESLDLSNFNTSKVEKMESMFSGCSGLKSLNIAFDTTADKLKYTNRMFLGCSGLKSLTFGDQFDTSEVTTMVDMFSGCSGLTSLDLSNFNTSKVETMERMFSGCSGLESLNIAFDTTAHNLKNTQNMFSGCSGLTSLTFGDQFDTSEVTTMVGMFSECSGLESLNIAFDTTALTNTQKMFEKCSGLTSLTFGDQFDTSEVTTMVDMFSGCSGLTSLDLSNFDTSKVGNMIHMFSECSKLTSLNLDNFIIKTGSSISNMFSGCSNLTGVKINTPNDSIKEELNNTGKTWDYNEDQKQYEPIRSMLTMIRRKNIGSIIADSMSTLASPSDAVYDTWKSDDEKIASATESNCCYLSDEYLIFESGDETVEYSLDEILQPDGNNWKLVGDDITITFVIKNEKLVRIVYSGDERFNGTYISPNKQDEDANTPDESNTGNDTDATGTEVPYPFNLEEDVELEYDLKKK